MRMGELKRVIGFNAILFIILNSIMGTGIFFLPAVSARYGGPAAIISWVIMAAFAIYISMLFAELTSMFPTSGGIYDFCKHAYGRSFSFMVGWLSLIIGNITIAMLIVGAIQYLLGSMVKWIIILVSIIFIIIFNIFSYRGMKSSATMLVTFAFITLGTLLALIVPGIIHFNISNFTPFFTQPKFMILVTVFFVAETFFGWESVTFLAGEVKEGHRIVPKALVTGTIIISMISLIFVITSFGSIGPASFSQSMAPLADLGRFFYGAIGATVFTLLVYLSIIGSVADWVVSSPRLILTLAKDKLFFKQFGAVHSKYSTPHKAILLQMAISIVLIIAGAGSYYKLLELLVPLLFIMYSVITLAVVVLRYKQPHVKRYYEAPFAKTGPFVVVAFFAFLLVIWIRTSHNALQIFLLGLSLIVFGFPFYFLIEAYYNPGKILRLNNLLAYNALFFEHVLLPKKIVKTIFSIIGDIRSKNVLEFGCSVGTLTKHLAENAGSKGKIYAFDSSEKSMRIADRRVRKRSLSNVSFLHDTGDNKIRHNIPKVDVVVSAGSLSNIQDIGSFLIDLSSKMKKGSKVCFVDYDRFFYLIPNVSWIRDETYIKGIFRKSGFKIHVSKKKTFLWEYVFIYGEKIE